MRSNIRKSQVIARNIYTLMKKPVEKPEAKDNFELDTRRILSTTYRICLLTNAAVVAITLQTQNDKRK